MKIIPRILALASCIAFPALTVSGQTRTVRADVSRIIGPHTTVPLRVIGAGRANEGLRADWQEQLATVQREIGFQYIRMHGILNDDMGVYTEDSHGNPQYNFQYVDALYDALLKLHIRPFVELTFIRRWRHLRSRLLGSCTPQVPRNPRHPCIAHNNRGSGQDRCSLRYRGRGTWQAC